MPPQDPPPSQPYGSLTALNTCRLLLDSVGQDVLQDTVSEFLEILGTSSAVYERNGDYAVGMFSSGWCRFLDAASRSLCRTDDNREALASGKWLCHESCWTEASKVSIETGQPVDIECAGSLRLLAAPILAGGEVVGSINIGYGDPPTDPEKLQEMAARFGVSAEELREQAAAYEPRSPEVVAIARSRLRSVARLLGALVDRKRAERELIEANERLTAIYRAAAVPLIALDAEGLVRVWSPAAERLLGWTEDEVLGRPAPSIPPEETAFTQGAIRASLAGEGGGGVAVRPLRKDGTRLDGLLWTAPLRDASGAPVGSLAAILDITERRRAEEAARASGEFAQAVLASMQDGLTVLDCNGVHVQVNDAFCKMTGFERHELIGVGPPHPYWAPEELDGIQAAFRATLNGQFRDWELLFVRKTGERFPVIVSPSSAKDNDGKVVSYFATVKDIAERKRAEEALRESEARHQVLLDTLPQKVFCKDRDSRYLYANRPYAEDLGVSPEEIVGRTDDEFYPAELAGKYRADDRRIMAAGRTEELDETYVQEGRERTVHTVKTPVRDGEGNVQGILGIFWDVTEQRALERQVLQTSKLEAIGTLAGGVAHDFNNTLQGIIGYTELLLRDAGEGTPQAGDLQTVLGLANRAAALTRHLLAFGRRQPLEPIVLDPSELLDNLAEMLRRVIGEDIELQFIPAADLGRVRADPGQIEQVLANLAANARDAMPNGGKFLIETANVVLDEAYTRRHVGAHPGPHVMLAVTDTGTGMDEGTLARVFEPFFTTKPAGRGTGLGLATAYGIVKQHGGDIWVYSEPGRGTTFKVYLPRVEDSAQTMAVAAEAAPPSVSETVLVVEDEESVRTVAARILESSGYTVLTASDAEEAAALFERRGEEIALLLTDVIMPGMSGRQLSERLAAQRPSLKVLFMSGYTDNVIMHHGVLDPGTPFIQKPFVPDALARKVREVLDSPGPSA